VPHAGHEEPPTLNPKRKPWSRAATLVDFSPSVSTKLRTLQSAVMPRYPTPNPEPRTPNPEPRTPNPRPMRKQPCLIRSSNTATSNTATSKATTHSSPTSYNQPESKRTGESQRIPPATSHQPPINSTSYHRIPPAITDTCAPQIDESHQLSPNPTSYHRPT
jgi:hypothetical protein